MQEKHTLPHPQCHAHTSYCSVYKVSKSTGAELSGSSEWYAVQKQWGGGEGVGGGGIGCTCTVRTCLGNDTFTLLLH